MSIALKITVQSDIFIIMALTLLLISFVLFVGNKVKNADPLAKPTKIMTLGIMIVQFVDGMVGENIKDKNLSFRLAPYIGTIMIYIFISNILGLFAFESPTGNFSVTFTLALITWILIQRTAIRTNKLSGYLHGFIEPHPAFFIMNIFGKIAPLISMPLRLFGNILSGSIILTLVYTFTGYVSSFIPILGQFNFLGVVIAPVLHGYFDVFAGFIQMFIFITLTSVFIGNELPNE